MTLIKRIFRAILNFFMRLFRKIFHRGHHHPHLSVIIPFREGDDKTRDRVFRKVVRYYERGLPEAEIIIGVDPLNAYPFNKSAAINAGFRHCLGRVVAVVDADCYMNCDTIRTIAKEIEDALDNGERMWYIPYERFYRLNKETTLRILPDLSSKKVYNSLGDPPVPGDLDPIPAKHSTGHYYGAMIQIMPREAFELVDGWDVIFEGWGSEDVCMLYSLDTLYCKHKVWDGPVYHLWHHINFGSYAFTRTWIGQETPENNWKRAVEYKQANGSHILMTILVNDSRLAAIKRNERLQTTN